MLNSCHCHLLGWLFKLERAPNLTTRCSQKDEQKRVCYGGRVNLPTETPVPL